jgi:serine/threonine-protein kinase RIO1
LFQGGHLVHGDLSEYNILVAPSYFVVGPSSAVVKNNGEDLQIVLIDFGQAVDTRHPEATLLLERDLNRVLTFFTMQGIEVPTLDEAMVLVMG